MGSVTGRSAPASQQLLLQPITALLLNWSRFFLKLLSEGVLRRTWSRSQSFSSAPGLTRSGPRRQAADAPDGCGTAEDKAARRHGNAASDAGVEGVQRGGGGRLIRGWTGLPAGIRGRSRTSRTAPPAITHTLFPRCSFITSSFCCLQNTFSL